MTNKNRWIFVLLLVPLLGTQIMHEFTLVHLIKYVLISLALAALLNVVQKLQRWKRTTFKWLLICYYFVFLFSLIFEVTLFDFTGRGFTNEVYFHFELESMRIAFNEYPLQILTFAFLVVLYVFLLNHLLKNPTEKNHLVISSFAMIVLILVSMNSSVTRFSNGFIDYLWEDDVTIDQQLINQYLELGVLSNSKITTRKQLQAKTGPDSKNLILLYLESFNQGLLQLDQYPGLTPRLNQLSQTYQQLDHLSSSYVTIEGVISSQCGTMLPMTAGNNTFLNNGQLMSNMPCLGDVLNKAGYTQYYLGGAAMEFAGKGRFFEQHGYDYIWGSEYWYANGFKQPSGVWGLSDTELFNNALSTIKQAAENPPYNVTLLTLGTHLPGYIYEGCQPYPGSDEPFINAIHCTDQLVGRFMETLEKEHLLDDAVLMIVADHGVFPTQKMRDLFGDMVDDRRLIGITNIQQDHPQNQLSSYDLAPSLLDMLNVEHNAQFLFGQSLRQKTDGQQKYVTRYLDWQGTELINNPPGECAVDHTPLSWPLNGCQKQKLLGLTSQLLEYYSIKQTLEHLPCQLDINFSQTTIENQTQGWSLMLNEENHFKHFYLEGRQLNPKRFSAGTFVFILNDKLGIKQHHFYPHDTGHQAHLKRTIESVGSPVLVINAYKNDSEPNHSLKVDFYNNNQLMWVKNADNHTVRGIDLCQ